MGVSTDGQICYGIAFDEETEFPWGEDEIEDWWIEKVHGFKPSRQLYDDEGQYIGGVRPPDDVMDAHFAELRAFREAHPLPVKLVNHCSYDYPMYILAVPGTHKMARRGFPEAIDPASLSVTQEQREALLAFCREHGIGTLNGIEVLDEPKWWLSSMWG